MKKYIQRDLRRHVDCEIVRDLEKCQYSQKAEKTLQVILSEMIQKIETLESEKQEADLRIKTMSDVLSRQHREIVRRNEAEDREGGYSKNPVMTRNEKIRAMYANDYSQREIAKEVGLSQPRVKEIIDATDNPLFTLGVKPENFMKFAKKPGGGSREERDLKICEWRDLGYSQKAIARGTGLSISRISEIVSEKCTRVHKIETVTERAKKNGVHRNTQSKIDKIRKVAPWLADKCEAGEMSVSAAVKLMDSILKPSSKSDCKQKAKDSEAKTKEVSI